jgi:hypothetical protein
MGLYLFLSCELRVAIMSFVSCRLINGPSVLMTLLLNKIVAVDASKDIQLKWFVFSILNHVI